MTDSAVGQKGKTMREWIVPDNDIGVDGAYFDYQELLRCKDCKYYHEDLYEEDELIWCRRVRLYTDQNHFCAWAERKE